MTRLAAAALLLLGACARVESDAQPGGSSMDAAADAHNDGVTIEVDAAADAGSDTTQSCLALSVEGESVPLPADIIWAVDQSGSMDQETEYVQSKLNDFAALVGASNVDYRVVVIASPISTNAICVPPPLSAGGCGDGPRYRSVSANVQSSNALSRIVETYGDYSDFLRPNAVKHIVVVSDDDARPPYIASAAGFTNALSGLGPAGMFDVWRFHGIFSYVEGTPFLNCVGPFGTGVIYGEVYADLVEQTGGAKGPICSGDWSSVFSAITSQVVNGTKIGCVYSLPEEQPDQPIDPDHVNVEVTSDGGAKEIVPRVLTQVECSAGTAGGWYYDDNDDPSTITLCPETCSWLRALTGAGVHIQIGCASIIKPPT